jgi:type IV pilus assembly protein PilB
MKLGELLVKSGTISEDMLAQALEAQKKEGTRLGTTLINLGYVKEDEMLIQLAKHFGVRSVDLRNTELDDALLELIPGDLAGKYLIVPIKRYGRTLTIAMINPGDLAAIEDIQFATGFEVNAVVAAEDAILNIVQEHYNVQKMLSDVMYEI